MTKFQIQVIKDALDSPESLTDWEYDIVNQWAELCTDVELTDKQNKILEQINKKLHD